MANRLAALDVDAANDAFRVGPLNWIVGIGIIYAMQIVNLNMCSCKQLRSKCPNASFVFDAYEQN